ncbi:MAG TPA: glycosyltransferase [Ktedonobacterales bacterium]|nr:glycosyltransferase [Ktedonobacterales bacterium]
MSVPPSERRVLFLIADTGAGHRSAANAIHHAMRMLAESPALSSPRHAIPDHRSPARTSRVYDNSGWNALIVDAFVACSRFPLRKGVSLYGPAIKHSPRLYGQFFRITNSKSRFRTAWRFAKPFLYQGLAHLLLETQPDVIVSVHPLLNHITLQVLRDLDVRVPFLTVVTDLVSIHYSWMAPGVSECVVPTEEARRFAVSNGMPAKRVHLLGMPIDPKFAQPPAGTRAMLRAELGLDPDLPTILLVGGGEGAIGLGDAAMAVGLSDMPVQMVVVCGRNKTLYTRLQQARLRFRVPTGVLGFIQNMPDLMHAADVIVTKAGPGTISEAMACGLPIVLTGAIPGQEEGNIRFVSENELGMVARTPSAVLDALRELLTPCSPRLALLRANVGRMSRPEASFDIARLILKYLPPIGSPSAWARAQRSAAARRYRPRPGHLSRQPRQGLHTLNAAFTASRGRRRTLQGGRLLAVLRARTGDRSRRIARLTDIIGARALLLRSTSLGKGQLRRIHRPRRLDEDTAPTQSDDGM